MGLLATLNIFKKMVLAIFLLGLMAHFQGNAEAAMAMRQLKLLSGKKTNVTTILVFGDSSVDPGNNNGLTTDANAKSNFPPYGKDFFNGRPTGRFCNGRLATDFIAETLGSNNNIIRAFLDPHLQKTDLLHGVSFASSGSGYDDLTANLSKVIPLPQQLTYFRHYIVHMRQLVGAKGAAEIIGNALNVLSMGTNDFLLNYFVEPTRPKQYSVEQYQQYLISRMSDSIKEMHSLGARRLAVVGLPPLGCFPLVRTLRGETKCVEDLNKLALSFNSKIKEKLTTLAAGLRIRTSYVDIYAVLKSVVDNPKKYGFVEASKGCCGSGTFEYGITCKDLTTCADRTKYVYWDAVHFTEKVYKLVAHDALKTIQIDVL